ncbi:MAG: MlaD family protein [Bacteroidales bacterium]|nr:MlaD family protein [Bacteroidales bacterium]
MKLSNEVKIALTAIAAVALLFVGINFLKGINVFESSNSYYVKFKDIRGLAVSNAVYANGYPVGIVREIDYNYSTNSSVVVRIELDEGMRVPRGTTAELETALMGGVTMSLLLGPNPSDNLAPHDTLTGGPKIGAMDQASAMIPDVQRMIPKLDSILGTLNRITADPALLQSLHNVATISENLKTTTAQLDRLMAREVPQMVGHLNRTSAHAEQISSDLAQAKVGETVHKANETLASVQQLSTQLHSIMTEVQTKMNSRDNNLGAFLGDRLLYDRLSRTVQSADSLVIDLKNNPKRYVHFSIFGRK